MATPVSTIVLTQTTPPAQTVPPIVPPADSSTPPPLVVSSASSPALTLKIKDKVYDITAVHFGKVNVLKEPHLNLQGLVTECEKNAKEEDATSKKITFCFRKNGQAFELYAINLVNGDGTTANRSLQVLSPLLDALVLEHTALQEAQRKLKKHKPVQ